MGMNISEDIKHEFPQWEELYQEQEIESMPWFNPELDEDLENALSELGVRSGGALDLGTGPGTQAIQLARRGFNVTATDISEAAIRLAREKARKQGLEITWKQDDILDTRLERQFDLIFDRGCFHVLAPERRGDYVRIVSGLLKVGGYLFLKCFSRLQPGEQGPYRFTPEQIREIFGGRLSVLSIKETIYQGTLDPLPRALFCTMRREG
jgi:cyclopropane fatty-acyl-phospholipid synthase-like methyltransferase